MKPIDIIDSAWRLVACILLTWVGATLCEIGHLFNLCGRPLLRLGLVVMQASPAIRKGRRK